MRVLDPDKSTVAVTLERGLDVALERTPVAIRAALNGPIARLLAAALRDLREEAHAIEGRTAPDEDPDA